MNHGYRPGRGGSGALLGMLMAFGTACGQGEKAPETPPGNTPAAVRNTGEREPVATRRDALATQTAVTYGYDALGRLAWAEYPASTKRIVYSYDSAGNRTQRVIDTTITNPTPALPTP
ncbi:hypothetical protein [Myxococcus sp. RHSTA-1-4]|uniref:hypothetical protein n=1 Tax=Myxococcus sp. RHSTA-1-4 TaxID=2874601 RepID=UPI001CBB2C7A|nr:hypothetical protein [Myxococcus sp. RHSTA-1-4]MBZ4420713.1 hypothetical protein [Myxococcus sp. RHSTA-1-4]